MYTKHIPPLVDIIDALVRGRLSMADYPFASPANGTTSKDRPQEFIVFIVNGTCYEEAHFVRRYNESLPGISIVLGGTMVHNSHSLIEAIRAAKP